MGAGGPPAYGKGVFCRLYAQEPTECLEEHVVSTRCSVSPGSVPSHPCSQEPPTSLARGGPSPGAAPSLAGALQGPVGEASPSASSSFFIFLFPLPFSPGLLCPHYSCAVLRNSLLPILDTKGKTAFVQKLGSGRQLLVIIQWLSNERWLILAVSTIGEEKELKPRTFVSILKWIMNDIKHYRPKRMFKSPKLKFVHFTADLVVSEGKQMKSFTLLHFISTNP